MIDYDFPGGKNQLPTSSIHTGTIDREEERGQGMFIRGNAEGEGSVCDVKKGTYNKRNVQ
jgi:hypothetical protein